MSHTVIYKKTKSGDVTKDGHTMFTTDIVTDLNRKAFLEVNKIELEKQLQEQCIINLSQAEQADEVRERAWLVSFFEHMEKIEMTQCKGWWIDRVNDYLKSHSKH